MLRVHFDVPMDGGFSRCASLLKVAYRVSSPSPMSAMLPGGICLPCWGRSVKNNVVAQQAEAPLGLVRHMNGVYPDGWLEIVAENVMASLVETNAFWKYWQCCDGVGCLKGHCTRIDLQATSHPHPHPLRTTRNTERCI